MLRNEDVIDLWHTTNMKEKDLEKAIVNYLLSKWAVCEWIQSGSVMVKKPWYNHRMTLQSAWCPDIIALYKWNFLWIEVKKNKKEVDDWIKKENRVLKWEQLPKSYKREEDQIQYKYKILENDWYHIITCDVNEIIWLIDELDE